jgi:alpha-L-rhamnosidase
VPDALDSAGTPAAAWGDAATIVPWVLYERFGDLEVLRAQYDSMRAWVEQILDTAGPDRLWEGSFQFGDWLDPDAPADRPEKAKADSGLVATAYLFRSTDIVAKTAELLGHTVDAARYRSIAEEVRTVWLDNYVTAAGRLASDAQTAYAIAIQFEIPTDPALIAKMGGRLAWLVRRDGYRIGTGFVGTPLVAHALSRTGHLEAATRLLLQTENPSWLYPVTLGATTIWERWDSMLEDGSINPGEMTSFNHYSLGAVADWLHGVVGGLSSAAPGYQTISIAPEPLHGFDWAETSHETPSGLARVRWETTDGGEVTVTASVPANAVAWVTLPGRDRFEVGSGSHEWVIPDPREKVVASRRSTDSSMAEIIDDQDAYQAVLDAMQRTDPAVRTEFRQRTAFLEQQPLVGATTMWRPMVVAEVERALDDLNSQRGL